MYLNPKLDDAGTPLGDPIEIGASTAVLAANPSSHQAHSLTIGASKSWIGHSEPAAGVVSMAHLCLAFAHQAALPIMHLRTINPHIHPMLHPGRAGHRGVHIPRQTGGLIGKALVPLMAGVSAFAFQGTNAHVIMAAATAADSGPPAAYSPMAGIFQQQRHWVAPIPHAMLLTAQTSSTILTYTADLATPANAYLMDHVVLEQCLLPATAFFELACASLKLSLTASTVPATIVDTTLAAPFRLHQPQHSQQAMAGVVSVQVDMQKGALTICSHSTSQRQYHVFAAVAAQQPATHSAEDTAPTGVLATVLGFESVPCDSPACPAGAVSCLAEPSSSTDSLNLHPATADSTLQLASSFTTQAGADLHVPSKLQAMHTHSDMSSQLSWACASPMSTPHAAVRVHSFGLVAGGGQAGATLQGLTLKPLSKTADSAWQEASTAVTEDCMYELTWPADCVDTHISTDRVIVPIKQGGSSMHATAAALRSLQAKDKQPRCFVTASSTLTAAGRPGESCIGAMSQASLVRTAAQESADHSLMSRVTDLFAVASKSGTAAASKNRTPSSSMGETSETASQGRVQHAPRLVLSQVASSPAPFQLLPQPRGALQNLVPVALNMGLAADEVLVEVHAVGINFRDVLNVLGMYPGDPGPPGADCAGVVTQRGAAVKELDIGKSKQPCI